MSLGKVVLLVVGIILNIIGLIYLVGSFATLSGNWFVGLFLMIIGGILIQIGKSKPKKQGEQSSYYCTECNFQTDTRSEILTHANTTGHKFTSGTRQPDKPSPSNSMEILKTRYAKGEITKEEFDRMKIDLE